jgi:hypothetical protein
VLDKYAGSCILVNSLLVGYDGGGCPVANKQDKLVEREWEAVKLYFEFFKHFSTLITAIALIVIGFFRILDLDPRSYVVVLVMLAIPLLLSLLGMANALLHAQGWRIWKFGFSEDPRLVPLVFAYVTMFLFIVALLIIVVAAVPPPPPDSSGCVFPGPPFC